MRQAKTPDIPRSHAPTESRHTRQDQVYHSLRQAIIDGTLARGMQVPSTRDMAVRWEMSRGTIEQAYERLTIEGYLQRRRGAGTFVAASLPEHFLLPDTPCRVPCRATVPIVPPPSPASEIHCSTLRLGNAFASPLPDPLLLDMNKWRRHLIAATRRIHPADMHLMNPGGLPALRSAIAGYVKTLRGIDCSADDVIVTTGIRQNLSLIAGMLDVPQKVVHIEDPGYRLGRSVFDARQSISVRRTPVDHEGLRVDALTPGCAAVYVTPAHQSPLGITMSASRRAGLLDFARNNATLIIEDDYDSEYSYLNSPPPALKSSDRHDQVLFCSSFNKVLYSALRIGFMIPPRSWRDDLIQQLRASGAQPGQIEQLALASMIESGDLYSHIRQSRRVYERRRSIIITSLARRLGKFMLGGEHCGLHFLLWLPPQSNDLEVAGMLERHGIYANALSTFCDEHPQPPALVLGFSSVADEALIEASDRLGELLAPLFSGVTAG